MTDRMMGRKARSWHNNTPKKGWRLKEKKQWRRDLLNGNFA